jgi:hypothetical protein
VVYYGFLPGDYMKAYGRRLRGEMGDAGTLNLHPASGSSV